MKRRDFVKNTAITALAATIISPLQTLGATEAVTHLESDALSTAIKTDEDFPLNFMAVGDWGRSGEYHQAEVAKQMGEWAAAKPNNFVISVGDNFYPRGVGASMILCGITRMKMYIPPIPCNVTGILFWETMTTVPIRMHKYGIVR